MKISQKHCRHATDGVKISRYSFVVRTGRLPSAKYGLERGGRTGPSLRDGLGLALSRRSRLKDASCLSGMNRAAKATPTTEPIFGGLSATRVFASKSRLSPS